VTAAFSARFATTAAILALGTGVAAHCVGESRAQTPGIPALVTKAVNGCFASAIRFTGLIVARGEAVVNLNMDGYQISEVLVAEGDDVTAGQVLARLTRFGGDGAPSGAGGQGAAAQQQQQQQQMPANMPLTAPAAGRLARSAARVGDVANPLPLPPPFGPEPLFRIIVGNELEVEGDVPSMHLPKLRPGQTARIQLDDGRELMSRVRVALPEVDRRTQLGKVRLSFERDPAIRLGMFARGTIDASHSCGVSIPRSAVQYRTGGATVQVLRGDAVETRQVRLGFFSDTAVEVREGIRQGEVVIANAGTSLHDGDRVKPLFSEESGPTGAR
jgi:HlyD family secretion protein